MCLTRMAAAAAGAALACLVAVTAAAEEIEYSPQYETCMDASNGVTFDMIDCMTAEHEIQDAELNAAYKTLRAHLTPERQEALKLAQRAWIAYRDANCDFYNDPDGGTMARLMANSCMLEATAERARELRTIAERY